MAPGRFILPVMQVPSSVWYDQALPATVVPFSAPDVEPLVALLWAHVYSPRLSPLECWILLPKDTVIHQPNNLTTPTRADVIEVPTGSGWLYTIRRWDRTALGFANEHQTAYCLMALSDTPLPPPPTGDLLLEDGTDLLLEDGTPILVE